MAKDLKMQFWKDIIDSLQLDESIDVSDEAQLCIFIWMVFTDMTAKEELLIILPMKGHMWRGDFFSVFQKL